jgi:signal transduction histidine kinase
MNTLLTLQAVTAFTTALLGVFVVVKKPSREASWYFGVFTLGTAFWAFSLFMAISQFGQPTLWGRLAISFGSFMPAGFYLFLSSFPRRSDWFLIERIVVGSFAIFFFVVSLSPLVVKEAWIVDGTYIAGSLGSWYFLFWLYYLGFLCTSFIKCAIKAFRTQETKERLQIRYITLGFALFFVPLLSTQFVLPLFGIFDYNSLGPLFSLPLIVIIAYSIVRHQLMDIRIIIQRSLIYAVLLALTAGFYLVSVYLVGLLFNSAIGKSTLWGGAFTTLFGVFTVPFIERYFRKITDRIFFKDRYDYPNALNQLSKILHTSVRQADIVFGSAELLRVLFKTQHVVFRLKRDGDDCPKPSVEAVVHIPILFEKECIGIIELGEKRSGERYTHEDHQLLETFAYQAAVSLEKARLYEKVEEYSSRLEHLVEERTQEIKKLQEDQKQTMIDISHNLQTPLAIVRGEIELLSDHIADPEKLRTVKKSLDRVSQFIRQLLHLAKLESSAFEIKQASVNLAALVEEQVEYFEVMAEEEGIEITTTVAPNVRLVGDRRLLQELLTNLVANSIRYRAKNVRSKVLISVAETEKDIVLTVQDNGIGIPADLLPEIFTRYAAASRAGAREDSTGLGLAICKRIAERHRASISVASEIGKGTEVTVIFPK